LIKNHEEAIHLLDLLHIHTGDTGLRGPVGEAGIPGAKKACINYARKLAYYAFRNFSTIPYYAQISAYILCLKLC